MIYSFKNFRTNIDHVSRVLFILFPIVYIISRANIHTPLGVAPEQILTLIAGLPILIIVLFRGSIQLTRQNVLVLASFWIFCFITFLSLAFSPFPIDYMNLKAVFGVFTVQAIMLTIGLLILGGSFWYIQRAIDSIVLLNISIVFLGSLSLVLSQDINFFRNGIYAMDDWWVNLLRNYTILFNPNYYARALLLTFPFLLVPIETSSNEAYRKVCLTSALGTLIIVTLTFSRMNLIVLLIVLLLVLYMYYSKPLFSSKIVPRSLLFGVITGTIFFGPILLLRFYQKIGQYTEHGTTMRIEMFRVSIESFAANPLMGTGPHTATDVLMADDSMREVIVTFTGSLAPIAMHNNYLLVLVENGGIAFILFIIFLTLYWRHLNGVEKLLENDSGRLKVAVIATKLSFVVFLLSGMTAVNFGMNIIWFILVIPLAIYQSESIR